MRMCCGPCGAYWYFMECARRVSQPTASNEHGLGDVTSVEEEDDAEDESKDNMDGEVVHVHVMYK